MIDNRNALFVRFNWEHTANLPLPRLNGVTFKDLHLHGTEAHPTGRKGLALASYWHQMNNKAINYRGMLTVDGDVAIDPLDLRTMLGNISIIPETVWTAPLRLWYEGSWYWSHRGESGELTNAPILELKAFSFGFTWLPAFLIELSINEGLANWCYPYVDESMSFVAVDHGIDIRLAEGCEPKHMHF